MTTLTEVKSMVKKPSTRDMARANEQKFLALLTHFGGATAPQLAAWTYPKSKKAVGMNKVYLMIKRLEIAGMILKREKGTTPGTLTMLQDMWILTQKGADFFNYDKSKPIAHAGYDYVFNCTSHIQAASIAFLTKKAAEGMCVIGPVAIRNGAIGGKELAHSQGVYFDPSEDKVNFVAIMFVAGVWDSTIDKAMKLKKSCAQVEFIGEPYNVAKAHRLARERMGLKTVKPTKIERPFSINTDPWPFEKRA